MVGWSGHRRGGWQLVPLRRARRGRLTTDTTSLSSLWHNPLGLAVGGVVPLVPHWGGRKAASDIQHAWALPKRYRGGSRDDCLLRVFHQHMPRSPLGSRGVAVRGFHALAAARRARLQRRLLHNSKWAVRWIIAPCTRKSRSEYIPCVNCVIDPISSFA